VKAVVYSRYGATPALTEVPDPACPADGVMIGAALGARVLAVDVSAAALDRARELGAEAVLDAGPWPLWMSQARSPG
jgi:hypothetical protein